MEIDKKDIQRLLDIMKAKNYSVDNIIQLIDHHEEVSLSRRQFQLEIYYTRPLHQAIVAGGYDVVNNDINSENFPTDSGGVETKAIHQGRLFCLHRGASAEEIIVEMDKEGYRPAILMELLVFGATNPGLQEIFLIIALGSTWKDNLGGYYFPCLNSSRSGRSGRRLDLHLSVFIWMPKTRFLGVKK